MKQSRHTLATALADRITSNAPVAVLSKEIAAYLLDQRRTNELESVMRDIIQIRADNGIVEVIARSAFSLSDEVKRDIETQVRHDNPNASKVIISEQNDQSVVAGVKLEYANRQLDMTVQAKLAKFKQLTGVGKER